MAEMLTVDESSRTWTLDADAFAPEPKGHVLVGGQRFPIYDFLDLEIMDSVEVTKIGEGMRETKDYGERMERSVLQVIILNRPAVKKGLPVLTREHFRSMSPREVIAIVMLAADYAEIPLKAGAGEQSASASPSPASAASTAGAPASSSPSPGGS